MPANDSTAEFNPLVSCYPDAFENLPEVIAVSKFIADVKRGTYAGKIKIIRQRFHKATANGVPYADAKKAVDAQKKKLCAITLAGKQPMRGNKFPVEFTGLIQADFDLLGDKLQYYREVIASDPHVFALFLSATGEGLKAFYRIPICKNADEYKIAFDALAAHVEKFAGCKIDPLKEVARLCYTSHDKDCFHNPQAVELPVDFSQPAEEQHPTPAAAPKHGTQAASPSRRAIAANILGDIDWQNDATGDCRCPGEALHTTGEKPHECQIHLDRVPTIHCVHKSCESAVAATNQRLRSEVGKAERPAAPDPLPGNDDPPEPAAPQLDIAARLAAVRFNIHVPPPLETAVFKLTNGATTHTRGNISALTAQAKAGKSALIAALIAAGITPRPDDCDLLGFRAVNPDGLPLVLLDTEHSPAHNWQVGDRILRRAMLTESDRLHIYRLAGFTVRELNAALDHLLTEQKWLAVFLDGAGDFVSDVNDAEECNAFVARLHGLAIEHDTHILNALHLNPSSETKSRGHFGSQLERKAETNLRIEKKDGVSTVHSDRNRGADISKDTAPRFVWSAEHQMHVSAEAIGKAKHAASVEELREQCREAFRIAKKTALTWTDLVQSLRKVPGVQSDRTAQRIHTDAKREGVIVKNVISQWELA